jgi:hypothetical protein
MAALSPVDDIVARIEGLPTSWWQIRLCSGRRRCGCDHRLARC